MGMIGASMAKRVWVIAAVLGLMAAGFAGLALRLSWRRSTLTARSSPWMPRDYIYARLRQISGLTWWSAPRKSFLECGGQAAA